MDLSPAGLVIHPHDRFDFALLETQPALIDILRDDIDIAEFIVAEHPSVKGCLE